MKFIKYHFLYLSIFLFTLETVSGQENLTWTRFRGSDASGIVSNGNSPVKWDSTAYRWQTDLPGKGHAAPVIWENKIFINSSDDEKNLGYALAIDAKDGKIIWKKEFNVTDLKMHVDNDLAAPSPAIDESQVYFVWYSIEKTSVIALKHDGTLQWTVEYDGIQARHGGGSSISLTDKFVIFTREQENTSPLKSSWLAVDKITGKTVWEIERESAVSNSFSTPLLLKRENQPDQLIYSSMAHGLTGVNPENGQILWERKELLPDRCVSTPIYSDGFLIACRKGGGIVFDLDYSSNQPANSALYQLARNITPYVPTPIVVGENLFLFSDGGTVACLQLSTGKLLWKEKPAGPIYGSPICVDGNLYCITKAGDVLVIRADSTYQLLGINKLGEQSFSSPILSEYGMVFRTFSRLISL